MPDDFDSSIYTTAENLYTLSLNVELGLDLQLKGQEEQVRLEKYLDLFLADLGLKLGLDMFDNIDYQIGISVGANLALNEPNDSNIVLEIKNKITNKNIIAIYVNGGDVYVDLGNLGSDPFYIEQTNISEIICDAITKLLGDLNSSASKNSGASTASDTVNAMSADEQMQLVLDIADGKLGVLVMQNVLVGLIAALTSKGEGSTDIATIIEKLDLDISVGVDLQLDPSIAINVDIDSNLLSLGVSIDNIDLATGKSSNAFNTIDAKAKEGIDKFVEITDSSFSGKKYSLVDGKYVESADGNFRRYYRELNNAHIVSLDLSLIVDYYASSTYVYVDDAKTLEAFSPKDRYSLNLYDNRFVQDDNGHYIREGFEFDELLNVILGMDGLKDVLATMLPQIRINTDNEEIGFDVTKNAFSVGELFERLGLNTML